MAKKKQAAKKKKAAVRKKATKKKAAVKKKAAGKKAASVTNPKRRKKATKKKAAKKAAADTPEQPTPSRDKTKTTVKPGATSAGKSSAKKKATTTKTKKKVTAKKKSTSPKKAPAKKKTAATTRPKKSATAATKKNATASKRKKAAKKKTTTRKKSSDDRKAVSADDSTTVERAISDDPRQMRLFALDEFQSEPEPPPAVSPVSKPEPSSEPEEAPVVPSDLESAQTVSVEAVQQAEASKPPAADPKVGTLVTYLEREGVLRTRVDPDTGQSVVQLYHDYLSRAVVEAERRADYWPTVIRDAQQQFDEAGSSFRRRWRAMLSPWQQIRLLIERLRTNSNFIYGPQRQLAAYSLCRFVPHLVVMLALVLGWNAWEAENQRRLDRAEARKIMALVGGTTDYPSLEEYQQLERLADSSAAVRLAFIDQLLETEENARSLKNRYAYVLHAVVGLDVMMRDRVQQRLLVTGKEASELPFQTRWAIAELATALRIEDNQIEDNALDELVAAQLIAAMKETTDFHVASFLERALGSRGDKLDAASSKTGAELIISAMKETTDLRVATSLGRALGSLCDNLDAASAKTVAELIVVTMKEETFFRVLFSLESALGSLDQKLDADSAKTVAKLILSAMKEETDFLALSCLGSALGSLSEILDAASAKTGAELILIAMKEKTDIDSLSSLGRALGSLSKKLDAASARAGTEQILAATVKTTDNVSMFSYQRPPESLVSRLETRDLLRVMKSVVCITEIQKELLAALNAKAGLSADGNLWEAVAWAKEQGIDINAVPRSPMTTQPIHEGSNDVVEP